MILGKTKYDFYQFQPRLCCKKNEGFWGKLPIFTWCV